MANTSFSKHAPYTDGDLSADIDRMVNEKGTTCVSIIMPTHRVGGERQADPLEVEKAVAAAKDAVAAEPGLTKAIDGLVAKIDFTHNQEGIGLFVSSNFRKFTKFPFPVSKKITIGKMFHLQELIEAEHYQSRYYLVHISGKEIHLFQGRMDQLEEISDENFPTIIVEEYEYSKPSRGSSGAGEAQLKGFEKDKSELQQLRLKKYFKAVDRYLLKHIDHEPLVICGAAKVAELFRSVTMHPETVVAIMGDDPHHTDTRKLELHAWAQVHAYLDNQKSKLVDQFREKIGGTGAICGAPEVWQAASEGRGSILIVERDFQQHGFMQDEELRFHPDLIDEIVNMVIEKKGKVVIVDRDLLRDYDGVGLLTRY